MPQLILKLKGSDFDKGLSLQSRYATGGLFQQAVSYDPFLKMGRLYPTLAPTRKDNVGGGVSIGVPINAFDFYSDGTNRFLFAFGDKTAGNIGAYKVNLDTDAITDLVAAGAFANRTGFAEQCSMVKVWNSRIIYDERSGAQALRSADLNGGTDATIMSGLTGSPKHPSVVGPDSFFYFGNGPYIGRLYSSTAASITLAGITYSNSATAFDTHTTDMTCRDIDHDGYYIFAGFDNNHPLTPLSGLKSNCKVIIWDKRSTDLEKAWDVPEAYIIAVRCLGQDCYVLTPSGWYVCSIATPPKLVYPMTSETSFNYFPTDYNGVSKDGSSIYWIDSAGTGRVFAIGQKIAGKKRIVYSPYVGTATTENMQALAVSNSYIYTSTSINRIYKLNSGTNAGCTLSSCPQYLPQPYTFSYTKVKLARKMGVGDSVIHGLYNSDGELISDNETVVYNSSNPLKTLVFRKYAFGTPLINDFTDCYPTISTNCEIAEVEVYGDPLPIHSQQT